MSILETYRTTWLPMVRGTHVRRATVSLFERAQLLEFQNAELLEALKAIERIGDNNPDCNHCGEYLDAREIARKAIAKAEGRA